MPLIINHYSIYFMMQTRIPAGRIAIRRLTGWIPAVFILLFVYTGCSKLLDLEGFTGTLYNQPIPRTIVPFLTIVLPILEVSTAICLLFNRTRLVAIYSALCMLIVFTLYAGAILLRLFNHVPCSCGGIFRNFSWGQHLWLNLALVILAFTALRHHSTPKSPLN
jgi:putative oxidoreductase